MRAPAVCRGRLPAFPCYAQSHSVYRGRVWLAAVGVFGSDPACPRAGRSGRGLGVSPRRLAPHTRRAPRERRRAGPSASAARGETSARAPHPVWRFKVPLDDPVAYLCKIK